MSLGKLFSAFILTGFFAYCSSSSAENNLPSVVVDPNDHITVSTESPKDELNDFLSKIKDEQVIAADPAIPLESVRDYGELPEISIGAQNSVVPLPKKQGSTNVYQSSSKTDLDSLKRVDMSTEVPVTSNSIVNKDAVLPDLNKVLPFYSKLDQGNFDTPKKAEHTPLLSSEVVTPIVDTKSKCSATLPCIPMYNRYMMKLDENDSALTNVTTFHNEATASLKKNGYVESSLTNASELLLPTAPRNEDVGGLSLDEEIYTPDIVSMTKGSKLPTSDLQPKSEQDFLIEKLAEKGVFIEAVKTDKKNVDPLDFDEALKNNPFRNLEHKSTEELILTEEKIQKIIGVSGQFMRGYSEAKDKSQYIKSLALSQVNGIIDSQINEFLNAYDGVNAQISSRISFGADGKSITVRPEGKVLVPLYSVPKSMTYLQAGLTTGTKNRYIGHIALGERFYPFAESMKDLGNHMFGLNLVYDYDFTRGHKRGSIGFEYMYNNLKLVANIYRALSGWKDSPDFEKGYVEERAASGWDALVEYWFTSKFALKAGVTHWIGDDVSPFGDSNPDKLENNPFIYQLGLKYNPVPALSFETNYQQSGKKGNRQFYIGLNFNIPFGYDLDKAFDPDATNKASGNMIMTSRSMFIERDYTMPLQYRSKPGKYYITLTKTLGNNRYLFHVEDGFHRPAPFVPATVTSTHKSVKFSNNGLYVSDGNGNFIVEIIQSAVPKDTIHVRIGDTVLDFTVVIDKLDWKIKAEPVKIERYETSTVTLYLDIQDKSLMNGEPVTWQILNGGRGKLKNANNTVNGNGVATVIYTPDTNVKDPYEVEIGATVCGVLFKTKISLVIYGRGKDAFKSEESDLDGGENTKLQYDNLRPGTDIEFTATGTCQVVAEKPEGSIAMTNAPATGQKLTVKVDKEGKAVVYVVASTQEGATGDCIIKTRTSDPYFNEDAPFVKIKTKVYDAVWELPSSTLYLEPFTATLTKLKDGTNVIFGIDNDSASIQQQGTSLMRLASAPNDAHATKTVKASGNKASADYLVTGDYTIQKVSGITAKYYHDAYNTQYPTNASILAIQQFTPYFTISNEDQEKLDYFSGKDSFKVTLTGGQPRRALSVTCPEGIVDISAPAIFDATGSAVITITGQDVRGNTPFTIVAQSMGKTQNLTGAVKDGKLTYHVYAPVVASSKGINGTNITDTSVKTGLPSFKDAASTIDYKTSYEIKIKGLLRNTNVSFSCTNGTVVSSSSKVDENGEVKVVIGTVEDYSIKNLGLNLTYQVNSVPESATTANYPLALYQYPFSLTSSSSVFSQGANTATLTLSGARVGETVNLSNTGLGSLGASTLTVDSSGNASTTVNAVSPYNVGINISCSTFGYSNNLAIHYTDAFAVNTVQGISGTNITDTAVHYGAPAFRNAGNTIDYKTNYRVTLKGLLPGTSYTVTGVNTSISSQSSINANGEASFVLSGVSNYGVKAISYTVTFRNNTGNTATSSRTMTYNLYQYGLSMWASSDSIVAAGTSVVYVSGGRPYEGISWGISGSGQYTARAGAFDASGNANATVQGVSPYSGTITATATQLGSNSISKSISISDPQPDPVSFSVGHSSWAGHEGPRRLGDYTGEAHRLNTASFDCWTGNATGSVTVDGNEVLHPSSPWNEGIPLHSTTTVSGPFNANTTFDVTATPGVVRPDAPWNSTCTVTVSP